MSEFASQVPLAFAAGLLSVLSPCVLPLMPAYLSLVSGVSVEEMTKAEPTAFRGRVLKACLGFVMGFSVVFIIMGIGAFAVGHVIRSWHVDLLGWSVGMAQIAGVVIVIFGLHMTGLVPIPLLNREARFQASAGQRSFGSTFLIGGGFALGWSPCIGPILSTVLTLAGSTETVVEGTLLLAIYSSGLAVPFLLAGWSLDFFFRAFARIRHHFRAIEITSGVLLMGVGLLLVTNQFTRLNGQFAFLTDWLARTEQALR